MQVNMTTAPDPGRLHQLVTRRERLLALEKEILGSADRRGNWHEVDMYGTAMGPETQLSLEQVRQEIAACDFELRSAR